MYEIVTNDLSYIYRGALDILTENYYKIKIINNDIYNDIKEYLDERGKINTKNPYLFVG